MPHAGTNGEREADQRPEAKSRPEAEAEDQTANAAASGRAPNEPITASGLTHSLSNVARPDPSDQVLTSVTYRRIA